MCPLSLRNPVVALSNTVFHRNFNMCYEWLHYQRIAYHNHLWLRRSFWSWIFFGCLITCSYNICLANLISHLHVLLIGTLELSEVQIFPEASLAFNIVFFSHIKFGYKISLCSSCLLKYFRCFPGKWWIFCRNWVNGSKLLKFLCKIIHECVVCKNWWPNLQTLVWGTE